MTALEQIGEELRKGRCRSQKKVIPLAELSGINKSALYRYEHGETLMRLTTLRELCELLQLDFERLSALWGKAALERGM
ncbi:MAG: helix-turn-helix transcriptional regulator [Pyramidobacter sp.]|nr:helix-turn-helix transcriptional regulator [Pyramidobacter sp.]MBQ8130569.1 helix-turn-helix transcriptional regulator [Clostridia bacterium]